MHLYRLVYTYIYIYLYICVFFFCSFKSFVLKICDRTRGGLLMRGAVYRGTTMWVWVCVGVCLCV